MFPSLAAFVSLISGYKPKDFIDDNRLLEKIVHQDDKEIYKTHFTSFFSNTNKGHLKFRIVTKSNAIRWISHKCVPLFHPNGNLKGRRVTNTDITEEIEALQWLKLKSKALESISSGIIITDVNGTILWVNPGFTKLTGYTILEIIGKNPGFLKSGRHTKEFYTNLWETILQGKTWRGEITNKKKNGEVYLDNMTITPVFDETSHKISHFIAVKEDISERKKNEEELNRLIEEIYEEQDRIEENASELVQLNAKLEISEEKLQELNSRKDRFFSILAHDLKNPFTALIGYSEMLLLDYDEFSEEEKKEFIGVIFKTSKNVYELLENLLDWSRMQTGKLEMSPKIIDFHSVAKDVYNLTYGNATKKQIELEFSIPEKTLVFADKNAVSTVLRNLVTNAIKFTSKEGKISVKSEEEENYFKITVEDNGLGISEEVIGKLFRIDSAHTTSGTANEKGTGLGLILCKELVEKSGGTIWVESEEGKGSKFIFTLAKAE
ncbi:MAG: PAS domain S-box protein [Chlorobi bacterium]|nr:PAS domain S-box protein [Chlorobiota bacterium]